MTEEKEEDEMIMDDDNIVFDNIGRGGCQWCRKWWQWHPITNAPITGSPHSPSWSLATTFTLSRRGKYRMMHIMRVLRLKDDNLLQAGMVWRWHLIMQQRMIFCIRNRQQGVIYGAWKKYTPMPLGYHWVCCFSNTLFEQITRKRIAIYTQNTWFLQYKTTLTR